MPENTTKIGCLFPLPHLNRLPFDNTEGLSRNIKFVKKLHTPVDIIGFVIPTPCSPYTTVVSNSSQNIVESFDEIKVLGTPGIFPFPDDNQF